MQQYVQFTFLPLQQDPYIASMEHHTDWVNDIVLCCNGKTCEFAAILFRIDIFCSLVICI